MMGQQFWLGCSSGKIAQRFGSAPMQNLASALKQIFVGRVLCQGVLETIFRFGTSRMSASASRSNATCSAVSSTPVIARMECMQF